MANQLLAFPTRLNPPTLDCALIFQYRSIYGHKQTLNPSPFIWLVTIQLDKFRYFGQEKMNEADVSKTRPSHRSNY